MDITEVISPAFMRTLAWQVHKVWGHGDVEELMQWGWVGALDAAQRFDHRRATMRTFVRYRAVGAMHDSLRRGSASGRCCQKHLAAAIAFDQAEPVDQVWDPPLIENEGEAGIVARELRAQVVRLSYRERRIVEGVYFEELQKDQIARELGVSASRVSQLHQQAMRKLRQRIAA
jgi:RNA polymerase sigma factor (sigma-70 family)